MNPFVNTELYPGALASCFAEVEEILKRFDNIMIDALEFDFGCQN